MGNWSPEGWVVFFGAAGTFIALLAANLVTVIKAARDRVTIAAATTTQLTEIAKATGAPVTATVPPSGATDLGRTVYIGGAPPDSVPAVTSVAPPPGVSSPPSS